VYDSFFVGGDWALTPSLDARATGSWYIGDQVDISNVYSFNARSLAFELSYKLPYENTLSWGNNYYRNYTKYTNKVNVQKVQVHFNTVALKTQWPNGWYSIVQYADSDDFAISTSQAAANRAGHQVSIRLAKNISF
jgi:hypothetical protein